MKTCDKQHRYDDIFNDVIHSQASDGRHKCAGCAYELGFTAGSNDQPSNYEEIVHDLPGSQAGTVRHKDAKAAYDMGYTEGKKNVGDLS